MSQRFSDAARAELAEDIQANATSFSIIEGGAEFPVANVGTLGDAAEFKAASGDWFKLVIQDSTGFEVVYVGTHTAGNNAFSAVLRGQEGTTARAFSAHAVVGLRPTAGDAAEWEAKEDAIAPGTPGQYWRGDKIWHTLNKATVGLANADNTSDVNKPISSLAQTALNNKVDKIPGKDLSSNDFTSAEKSKLAGVEAGAQVNQVPVDNLSTADANKPLSANQGRVLKGLVDTINTLLQSDDSSLDELQEIVNYIKLNRADLSALGIDNIAGLRSALDGKQPLSSVLTGTTAAFTSTLLTKLNGIAAGAQVNSVTSVASKTGAVTLTASDVGLANVNNTSDVDKPISTSTQTALNAKLAKAGDTVTNLTFDGSITEEVFTVSGTSPVLNPSDGTIQTWTLSAAATPSITLAAGQSFVLMIDSASYGVTWPAVTWKTDKGNAPELASGVVVPLVFWRVGTTTYGARVGDA